MKTPHLCLKFWIETGVKIDEQDCTMLRNMPESARPQLVREILAASHSKGDQRRRRKGLLLH